MKQAVLIPCYNEGVAIGNVVKQFKQALPDARVCVFDNNSTDNTREQALNAGAEVYAVTAQGKGNVVRRMFADIEADVYLMVDGDDTYDAPKAAEMVDTLVDNGLDMVVGVRKSQDEARAYRRGHVFGNRLLTGIVRLIFGYGFSDMLSGYRVFSRRFVKTFPAASSGFETETELTIHALRLELPCAEVETKYAERPEGSTSKLSTYKDGFKIMSFILFLFKEYKPFQFFGLISLVLALTSIGLFIPVLMEFIDTGLVPRIPTAILSSAIMLCAFLSIMAGIILDSVSRGKRENLKLHYLNFSSVANLNKSSNG